MHPPSPSTNGSSGFYYVVVDVMDGKAVDARVFRSEADAEAYAARLRQGRDLSVDDVRVFKVRPE
jgi:hypothetical protein